MTTGVRSLKQALMPIIWLNCIFCMGIFEIPTNRPRFLLSALYVVSMISAYFALLYKEISFFHEKLSNDFFLYYCVLTVNILVAIIAIILFWLKSENINSIIKRFSVVDNTIEVLGIKRDYQRTHRNILYILALWIIGMLLLNLMHIVWMYEDTAQMGHLGTLYTDLCFCIPILANSVVDVTFASFIRCLQIKFQNTNILINNVVVCANKSNIFKIHEQRENKQLAIVTINYENQKEKILHLIQTLRHLHLEVTRIARQINHTYCLQLLLELAVHFTVVTTCVYCMYGALTGQVKVTVHSEKLVAMIVWAGIYSLKIMFVNSLCTGVSEEAYRTGEIMQSFDGSATDDDMREEIRQFTQQIVLNSLQFTASGFFSIDNTLTGKFFATVTTYVVILIQMNTPL
ncbi:putative gustatory receptor 28b [Cataglyphis hispanica]|uniref:putative gustatory receptor 28b n=1 Tax=Cataglyphis hispanica TaxID=1086592 RepID=UPI00217FE82F|nr:putative gustatory receptor 28b [Cataglyphis hispanica]